MARLANDLPMPIRRRKLLIPTLRDGLVQRPRLARQLDANVDTSLTAIVAPAGFGKTTVVAQWLAEQPRSAVWLTVDAGDADERRFISHLVVGVSEATHLDAERTLAQMRAPVVTPMADVGASLADDLFDISGELVIVLDDAHAAASPGLMSFLSQFLTLLPPSVHLVLLSRTDLPLSLARLKNQHLVNELRAADLRFTTEETEALVRALAPASADAATVRLLQEQTEGWVTGLRLAAQALALLPGAAALPQLASDRHSSMQFLVEEVLAFQSDEDQDFLLRTSVAEHLCPDLADALLTAPGAGSSEATLERLLQAGLFLEPMGEKPGWLRYHPLFHQLLRHQLARRLPRPEVNAIHVRAARWFAQRGMIEEGIGHSLAAGDLDSTAELVERSYHGALSREGWPSVARWLRLLPEEMIHSRPRLLLARGWVAHLSGRASPLRATLAEVESLVAQSATAPAERAALTAEAEVLGLATLLPIEQNPLRARQVAEDALRHLPAANRFALGLAQGYLGLVLQTLGQEREAVHYLEDFAERAAERIDAGSIRALLGLVFVHRQAGNYRECAEASRHTLTLAERHGLAVTAGWARMFLGWIAYERNDLDTAATHFAAVINDSQRLHLSCVRESMFGMALVLQAQGQPAAADAVVARASEIIIEATALEHLASVQGFAARLALLRQQTDAAAQWADSADVTVDSNTYYAFEHALLTKVHALLAMGTPSSLAQAEDLLQPFLRRAADAHHRARLIEGWALQALLHAARGRDEEAVTATRRAVDLVGSRPFCRVFLDLGDPMIALLRRAAPGGALPAPLSGLLQLPAPAVPVAPPRRNEPAVLALLTLRECDVLERLGRRLSYQEIGDELFISPGTVKRHVGSIYSKLGASNRREALIRAQDLGWQPDT